MTSPIRPGDLILFKVLPTWVQELPESSRQAFKFCLGRIYKVSEIDNEGLLVLDVSKDIDRQFGGMMNDIRVEERYVEKVSPTTLP